MPATTAKLIRDQQIALIEALSPDDLRGVSFREFGRADDFEEWADSNPSACMRRFQIMDEHTHGPPTVSDMTNEWVDTTFTVRIAYPKDSRYGLANRAHALKVIGRDRLDIDRAIGITGSANYVSGQQVCRVEDGEPVEQDNSWVLTMVCAVSFYLATGYSGNAIAAGTGGKTTPDRIRENQITLVEALTPSTQSGVPFREYRDKDDFAEWADAHPRAALRRFYIFDQSTYETISSTPTSERLSTTFMVQVAYPKSGRYGSRGSTSADDVMAEDERLIDTTIGALGLNDYTGGQLLCDVLEVERVELDNVWLLEFECAIQFDAHVGTIFFLVSAAATASVTATANGVLDYQMTAPVSASVTATAAGVIDYQMTAASSAAVTTTAACTFAAGGPNLLADFNFSAPLASWTTGRTGFSSAFATDEWLMQDASSPMANNVGSETLANTGGLVQQSAPDIHDGTAYGNRKAWEAIATGDNLTASGTTAGDSNNEDFCFRVVLRFKSAMVNNAWVIGKRNAAASYAGWALRCGAASNAMTMWLDSGAVEVAKAITFDGIDDGAWHYVTGWYDKSADMLYIKSDLASEVSADTSTITGSLTNTDPLKVNRIASLAGGNNMQVAYAGVAVGTANAQSMYDEVFWQHAQDPTSLLTTTSRNCLISVPISATQVGHFSGSTTTPQLPIGYNDGFSDTNKLGLQTNGVHTNLCAWSEALSNWTQSGTSTTTDNQTDSPDGFRSASLFTAGANNDVITSPAFTTTALTWYGVSVWIKESTAGATGRVIFYDETGAAEDDSTVFTATGSWQLVKVLSGSPAGAISMSIKVELDVSGESVYVWGASCVRGWTTNECGLYLRTAGSASTTVDAVYESASVVNAKKGEVKTTWIWNGTQQLGGLWASPGGSVINNRGVHMSAVTTFRGSIQDNAGVSEGFTNNVVSGGVEYVHRLIWDDSAGGGSTGGFEHVNVMNGVTTNGAASPWEGSSDDQLQDLALGAGPSTAATGAVIIQRIQSWDDVNEAIP